MLHSLKVMTFKFACPHCGQHIVATSAESGRDAPCPECNRSLWVPTILDGSFPPAPDALHGPRRTDTWLPAILAAATCSILSAGGAFFLASRIQTAPDAPRATVSDQIATEPAPKLPGTPAFSDRHSAIARLEARSQRETGTADAIPRGKSLSLETGIWPATIYPGEALDVASENTGAGQREMDAKGLSVMTELSAVASGEQNSSLVEDASEKMEFLARAFDTELRTKLPVYQEMRDAIMNQDEPEFFRQANTVNAIAVFNNGTSLCTKDDLLELATLLHVVMDSRTSSDQKEPMELMQQILDQARGRKPPIANSSSGIRLTRD
jgi:hypothetical protein